MEKILIVNGSPRKNGNSDYVSAYLKTIFPASLFSEWKLRETKIEHCNGCELCSRGEGMVCSKRDGFLEKAEWLLQFDGFLLISPVYQGGVTAQVKQWMDRCEMFRLGRRLKGKVCGGIAIGGYAGGGQELTLMQIQYFAHIAAMHYAASWGETRSHLGGHCIAGLKQEIIQDQDGLKSCENVVNQMVHSIRQAILVKVEDYEKLNSL